MLTMISNPQAQTHHLLNRDGTAALCRKNITPYTWTTARTTTSRTTTMRATYEVDGETFRRSVHAHRVTCLACQRKLAKITAEAFDAATAHQNDAVQTKTLPPVAVGSKMWNVLVQVRDYGNGLQVSNRTLDALVRRGLVTAEDTMRYAYSLTEAGVALVGRRVERPGRGAPAVPVPPVSPFPVGSHVAAHLFPERVYLVDSIGTGSHDGRTRVYLVHPDGERLAFQPQVLAKMYALAVAPVMLHDYQRGEAMHVLGQTFGAVGLDGLEELLFRYENDDQSPDAPYRSIPFSKLRYSHYYVATCPHAFENQGAGCLTCNPFPSTDHLIGRMVTLDPINNPRRGTVSGVLARTERGSSPDHVVGVLRSGYRVRVPRSLVEATLANLPKTSA